MTVRLSRFDLHLTFLTGLKSLICNILKVVLPIRSSRSRGELETKYWGSSGSNVQVRLYDKNKEIIAHKREGKLDLAVNCLVETLSSNSEPKRLVRRWSKIL